MPVFQHRNIMIAIIVITVIAIVYALLRVKPVAGATISSGFGQRVLNGSSEFHNGLDLAAPEGKTIRTVLQGKVETVGFDNLNGNYVKVNHGNYKTFYGHMLKASVKNGQYVLKGQKIGEVGNTGRSYGSHVHFMVINKNDQAVDPRQFKFIKV